MKDWASYAAHFKLTRAHDPAFLHRWMERVAAVAERTPADLPAAPWLDAGAGTGRFCAALGDYWDRDVIALEPQPVMIAAREPHPRVRWVCGSALAPPVSNRSFAGVWVHLVLHQIAPWQDAVRRLAARVAEGGIFAVRTFNLDASRDSGALSGLFPEAVEISRGRWMVPAAVAATMESAGLRAAVRDYADERETPRDAFIQKLESKSLSSLQMIDAAAFAAGMARARERFPPGSPPIRETSHTTLIVGVR